MADARFQEGFTVRNNATNVLQQRISDVVFWFSIVTEVARTAVVATILPISRADSCDVPARTFLAIYAGQQILQFGINVYHRIQPPPSPEWEEVLQSEPPRLAHKISTGLARALDNSFLFIFLFGCILLSTVKTCRSSSPKLYWTLFSFVMFDMLVIFLPAIFLMTVCFCLPCILIWMRFFYRPPNRGAADDVISSIPKYKYYSNKTEYDNLTMQPEDATCSICLQAYSEAIEFRILPCNHHFHKQCVDEWLKIAATCPLCVRPIVSSTLAEDNNTVTTTTIAVANNV